MMKKVAGLLLMLVSVFVLGVYFFMLVKGKAVLAITVVVSIALTGLLALVFWVGFTLISAKGPKILDNNEPERKKKFR